MSSIPPLSAVRAFESAARHENYSRAAEELGMTQAGVSYQIRLLEERLGAQLFARVGRGVALTPLGRRIAPRVNQAFAMMGEAFAAAREENEAVLNISAPRTFASNLLAERLGAFNLARPGLAVRLDVSDQIVDLHAGAFDMAIRGVREPPGDLACHFLCRQIATPMASPDFLARYPLRQPVDLLRAPRLLPADEWWGLWFDSLDLPGHEGADERGIRFDSQVLDGQAAIAGHGVAILSPIMFARALAAGHLVRPFAHAVADPRTFWLVYPEHKRRLAKVRGFREWLIAMIETLADDDPDGALQPPPPSHSPGAAG